MDENNIDDDLFNSAQFHKTHELTLHRQLSTVQLRGVPCGFKEQGKICC